MEAGETVGIGGALAALGSGIVWVIQSLLDAVVNLFTALGTTSLWLDWLSWDNTTEDKQSIMRFVYYGGSTEFFFVVLLAFLIMTAIGIYRKSIMWGYVIVLETVANTLGRIFAWAGLIMVLQQIVVVFMQRIFTRPDIAIGFGIPLQYDISWFGEGLKLYNAMIICMCVSYTFVQGGHVRVDLVYSAVKFRTKKVIDMVGSMIFVIPVAVMTWMYGWYFLWRHLITPKPAASWDLDRALRSARAVRWNVETIGYSPNGFTAYFLFKILLVVFAALIFLHGIAFFYRSFLEWREGQESENKHLDKDKLGDGEEAFEGTH